MLEISKTKKRVLLHGHLGEGNLGDEMMLAGLLRKLDASEITLVAGDHSNLDFVPSSIRRVPRRLISLFYAITRVDVLLVVGGTHVASFPDDVRHLHGIIRQVLIALWARLTGASVVMCGIGVGPLKTCWGRRWARLLFLLCRFISVRDKGSLELLRELSIPNSKLVRTSDPALMLELPSVDPIDHCLGFSLMPYYSNYCPDSKKDETVVATSIDLISRWLSHSDQARVRLIPFLVQPSRFSDGAVIDPVADHFSGESRVSVVSASLPLVERLAEIGACSRFISFRYHSMLLAGMFRIPQFAICYHRKNEILGREMGLHDSQMYTVEDFVEGKLSENILDLVCLHEDGESVPASPLPVANLDELLPPSLTKNP